MKQYITIDGDDIGRKISSCYIQNDPEKLKFISNSLQQYVEGITQALKEGNFTIIFAAADGIAAFTEESITMESIEKKIKDSINSEFTFSIGLGNSLQECYIALIEAKSTGKNKIVKYQDIPKN